jgi:hypothetical protein
MPKGLSALKTVFAMGKILPATINPSFYCPAAQYYPPGPTGLFTTLMLNAGNYICAQGKAPLNT